MIGHTSGNLTELWNITNLNGNSSTNGHFSIAMLDYKRIHGSTLVIHWLSTYELESLQAREPSSRLPTGALSRIVDVAPAPKQAYPLVI